MNGNVENNIENRYKLIDVISEVYKDIARTRLLHSVWQLRFCYLLVSTSPMKFFSPSYCQNYTKPQLVRTCVLLQQDLVISNAL